MEKNGLLSKMLKYLQRNGALILVGFFGGLFAAIFLLSYLEKQWEGNDQYVLVTLSIIILLFFFLYLVHIILHEAGHLLFGLMTGYTFVSFRIGSITIIREEGKLKRKRFNIPGTAGQCLLAPPPLTDGVFPYKLYNYGGVIVNLFTSCIAVAVLVILPQLNFPIRILFGTYACGGLLLGLTNGIPMKSIGITNDGWNVKCMEKDEQARKAFHLQLDINGKQSFGMRLKDMPEEWFVLPEGADLTNVMIAFSVLMKYYWYLDRMDFVGAKQCLLTLEPVLEKLTSSIKNLFHMEQLFLSLINQDNVNEISKRLTKEMMLVMKKAKYDIGIQRIVYAYQALYVKDDKAANQCYQAAVKLKNNYPVAAEAECHMMLMDYIKNRCYVSAEAVTEELE
jgi:hypothetical protein